METIPRFGNLLSWQNACGKLLPLLVLTWVGLGLHAQTNENADKFPCAHFLSGLRPRPQHFEVCVDRSILVKCKGGTEIFIPPHAFVFAENEDTILDVAKLQIQYRLDPLKPHAVGMQVSDPVDLKSIDKVDLAITELPDAKAFLCSNLNCNKGTYLLSQASAIRIKATSEGKKLKFRAGKGIIVLLPKEVPENLASLHGNHDRREFMEWIILGARNPLHNLTQLFPEQAVPSQLPLYLENGLANPKTKRFATGESLDYTLEHALDNYRYGPQGFNLSAANGTFGSGGPPDDFRGFGTLKVKIVVGEDGLAKNVRVLRDGRPVEMALLRVAAHQVQWDVSQWNLKDTITVEASRMHNRPEIFGSGISPEESEFFDSPNTIQWGKMVYYLEAAVGKEKANTLMHQGRVVFTMGWVAFGQFIYPEKQVVPMLVDLQGDFDEAKVMVYLPSEGIAAELRNPRQGLNALNSALPNGKAAKLIVIAHQAEQGSLFYMADFMTANGLLLKPELQPLPWTKIEAVLQDL